MSVLNDKAEWQYVPISSFLTCREGKYNPEDKEVCDLQRLSKIDFSGQIHVSDKSSKTDMIIVMPHDLVISGINVAKGAISVHQGHEPIAATIHYSAYTFDETKIDIEYFKRFLQSSSFVDTLQVQVKGGIKTEIKPKQFLPLMIHLPELLVQKEIAQHFQSFEQELFELSEELNQQSIYIRKLRQTILQEAIEGKLTVDWRANNPVIKSDPNTDAQALLAQIQAEKQQLIAEGKIKKDKPLALINDAEKPFELPDRWVRCRFLNVIKEPPRNGYSPKESLLPTAVKSLKLGATTTGVFLADQFKFIDEEIPQESYLWLKAGDILIQRANSIDYVGVSALFTGREDQFIYPDLMMKVQVCQSVKNEYVVLFLSSQQTREYFRSNASGAQKSMPKINQGTVINTIFHLPSYLEQTAIVEKVQHLLAQVDALETELKNRQIQIEQLMQAVLTEAFSPSL